MKRWYKEWEERGAETLWGILEHNPLGPATVKCCLYAEHRGDQTGGRNSGNKPYAGACSPKTPRGWAWD